MPGPVCSDSKNRFTDYFQLTAYMPFETPNIFILLMFIHFFGLLVIIIFLFCTREMD